MTKQETCRQGQSLAQLISPQLFKAMCDPNRIAILCYLSDRCAALTVSQIAESLPIDVSVVSRHLSILRDAEILVARKSGKEVHYSLNTLNLIIILRAMADALEACCPDECLISPDQHYDSKQPSFTRAKGSKTGGGRYIVHR